VALVNDVFFDTSILLLGLVEMGPASRKPQEIFDAIVSGRLPRPMTAWHCCLEFYAVSTRLPEEYRLPPADALRLMEEEISSRFRVLQLSGKDRKLFWRTSGHDHVIGGRIYDAHIAEIARTAGARTVVTENVRHFTVLRRHGIRVLGADEFLTLLA
jgi:predicted nucleic acid-binding protein